MPSTNSTFVKIKFFKFNSLLEKSLGHCQFEPMTTLDESLYSNYQILYSNFTDYVENVETEAFKQSVTNLINFFFF